MNTLQKDLDEEAEENKQKEIHDNNDYFYKDQQRQFKNDVK